MSVEFDRILFAAGEKIPTPMRKMGTLLFLYLSTTLGRNYVEYTWGGHIFRFGYWDRPTLARNVQDRFVQGNRTYEGVPMDFLDVDRSVDGILDIGGHFGIYTILLAVINSETPIFAFEPNSYNADVLRKNVELNDLSRDRLAVYQAVMSDHSGTHTIYEDLSYNGGVGHTLNPDERHQDFTARDVDGYSAAEFCKRNNISNCWAKIDAEGEELEILSDLLASEYVNRVEGVVDVHPKRDGVSIEKFLRLIENNGYTASEINPDFPDNNPAYVFEPVE